MGAFMEKFNNDLAESGELVETRGLRGAGADPAAGSKDGARW